MSRGTDGSLEATTLAFEFTGNRYHATPWGSHVNEGLVEWPPSPWRILRALVSTGFTRLGWTGVEGAARELFELLGSVPPEYMLPAGSSGHSRHYMPIAGGNTTKVIDTFLRFPSDARTLYVRFRTGLPEASREVLSQLLRSLGYLGRAESWVEARLVNDDVDGEWIVQTDRAPGPGYERVELLALDVAGDFREWRKRYVERALQEVEKTERAKADAKGKAFKSVPKKDIERIEGKVPTTVVDALLQDTPTLRREGWSQPPGTRFVSYFRKTAAVVPSVVSGSRRSSVRPTAALWAISSDTKSVELLPSLKNVVRFTHFLHEAIASKADGATDVSWLTGKVDGVAIQGHRHISLLPLALDARPGRFDHVLALCPMGFDEAALDALRKVRKAYGQGLPDLFISMVGIGDLSVFGSKVDIARRARVFRSVTPFVPSRHLKEKGGDTLLGQVRKELEYRGLRADVEVEVATGESGSFVPADVIKLGRFASDLRIIQQDEQLRPTPTFRGFVTRRRDRTPPAELCLSLRLRFPEEVQGPIALGYGAHFGLGLFAPEPA